MASQLECLFKIFEEVLWDKPDSSNIYTTIDFLCFLASLVLERMDSALKVVERVDSISKVPEGMDSASTTSSIANKIKAGKSFWREIEVSIRGNFLA